MNILDQEVGQNNSVSDKFNHLCAIDYFPDFKELMARSMNGCDFCHFLRNVLLAPSVIDYEYCNYRDVDDLSMEPFYIWVKWQWKRPSASTADVSNTLYCLTVQLWSSNVLFGSDRWDFCVESENGWSQLIKA